MTKRKVKYTNEPIGDVVILKDFLPSPDELVTKKKTVKVTLELTESSIDFFKHAAKKRHSAYQKMIRQLLDQYAAYYQDDDNGDHRKAA